MIMTALHVQRLPPVFQRLFSPAVRRATTQLPTLSQSTAVFPLTSWSLISIMRLMPASQTDLSWLSQPISMVRERQLRTAQLLLIASLRHVSQPLTVLFFLTKPQMIHSLLLQVISKSLTVVAHLLSVQSSTQSTQLLM